MVILPISWLKLKITMHLGYVYLGKTVSYDHSITNYLSKLKMTADRIYKFVHSIFINPQQILKTYWKS